MTPIGLYHPWGYEGAIPAISCFRDMACMINLSRLRKLLPGIFPVFVKTGNDLGKTARFFLNLFLNYAI